MFATAPRRAVAMLGGYGGAAKTKQTAALQFRPILVGSSLQFRLSLVGFSLQLRSILAAFSLQFATSFDSRRILSAISCDASWILVAMPSDSPWTLAAISLDSLWILPAISFDSRCILAAISFDSRWTLARRTTIEHPLSLPIQPRAKPQRMQGPPYLILICSPPPPEGRWRCWGGTGGLRKQSKPQPCNSARSSLDPRCNFA